MNARKRELLRDFPWDENYPKLVAFADWLIQGKTWNSNILPKGQTAESIVRDVIAKTFSEERNWDPERGELFPWLKWVIRSEVSHLAESASNRRDVRLEQSDCDEPEYPSPVKLQLNSPEDGMIATETVDLLLEACNGKAELEDIVYAISGGECAAKPKLLAEYLGRPVQEIYQDLRMLRRRAAKIRIEVEDGRK